MKIVYYFMFLCSEPPPTVSCMDKDDVYSFRVLAYEVVNARYPEAAVFLGLLSSMEGVWRELHPLITSYTCVSHSPLRTDPPWTLCYTTSNSESW